MPEPRFQLFRPVILARVFFILMTTAMAAHLAFQTKLNPIFFSSLAFIGAVTFVLIEYSTRVVSSRRFLLALFGLFIGLIFSQLIYPTIPQRLVDVDTARFVCNMMFGYFGVVLALRHSDWLRPGNLRLFLVNPATHPKVLDSSVIIDGRINEVVRLGLLTGPVIVPNFVLLEIQAIADSSDPFRRARGRRGLEVLDRLRTTCQALDIIDTDFPDVHEVDQKLVLLCQTLNADLVTNDYNLHKIAQLRHIAVINLNEISDSLKPLVYIGEAMELTIVKPGKEPGQGVGYLKDGTMVIVDNGEDAIGHDAQVVVSNILQNPSGRLIFARLREDERAREDLRRKMPA